MLAAPSRDWNVFKQIFADHWPAFQQAHPRYQRAYYDDLVAKMLACGHPEKMGYLDIHSLDSLSLENLFADSIGFRGWWKTCVSNRMIPPLALYCVWS